MSDADATLRLLMLVLAGIFGFSWLGLAAAFRLKPKASLSFFLANVFIGCGVVLVMNRTSHPGFASFQLADWLVIAGVVTFRSGILHLVQTDPPSLWRRYVPLWVEIVATVALPADVTSYFFRAVVFNAVASWVGLTTFRECVRGLGTDSLKSWNKLIIAWPFLGAGILFGARAAQLIVNLLSTGSMGADARTGFTLFLWTFLVILVLINISLIGLIVGKLILRLTESHRDLENALRDVRSAQSQLIFSEKMASLGQLIANVAHEINSPIGAVKASGENIFEAVGYAVANLPQVYQVLDADQQRLFQKLVVRARKQINVLSTREERTITRELEARLEQENILEPGYKAKILMELGAQSKFMEYVPLLRHPECHIILDAAHSVAQIIGNTNNIRIAVDRVGKIVFALKSFSRKSESEEFVEASLRDGIETVLTIYASQIKQGIELNCEFDDIAPIFCLPDQLNQVWTNLIHNALQAMKNQGTLTIGLHRSGDTAVVSIADNGCGIPQAIQGKIFDAFFTTKPAGEGSGLGLDIVKKIVEKHRGRIEVCSEPGKGATFLVYLPYAALPIDNSVGTAVEKT